MPGTRILGPQGPVLHTPPNGTLQTDYSPYINVYEMGATGFTLIPGQTVSTQVTGNGVTDDSAAINLAIAALAGTGYTLYFPAGTYLCTANTIVNASGVPLIFGPGASATGTNAATLSSQASYSFAGQAPTITTPTTGTITLTAAQYSTGVVKYSASLTGAVTIVFPSLVGAKWILDCTGSTLNSNTISAQANSVTWATTIGVTNQYLLEYGGVGKLYGTSLAP